jgi:hypothetical protein
MAHIVWCWVSSFPQRPNEPRATIGAAAIVVMGNLRARISHHWEFQLWSFSFLPRIFMEFLYFMPTGWTIFTGPSVLIILSNNHLIFENLW